MTDDDMANTTELRVDVPTELIQQLDAVMQSKGMKARADYVVPLLVADIAREVHAATLLLRMCRINPLLTEQSRNTTGKDA